MFSNSKNSTSEVNPSRRILILIFIISFFTIVVELILSRMAAFYLNYSNSFLAIPITLFGLALGSLHVHLSKKEIDFWFPHSVQNSSKLNGKWQK